MWWVLCVIVVAAGAGVGEAELTDEEYALFPKLFHLDEYQSCLARQDGLYCLGSFYLTPQVPDDPTYKMMLEYSKDRLHFNRTIIHRGYCVSARCPPDRAKRAERADKNETLRFEQCIDRWARSHGFRSAATVVQYCRTTEQLEARKIEMDTPKITFLVVVLVLLLFNAIGTSYDFLMSDDAKKSLVLVAWSVRNNWRRLTASYEDGDPRLTALAPLQGVRVLIMVLVTGTHGGLLHFTLYIHNPRDMEDFLKDPIVMLMRNGSSIVQVFVLMASFLLGYHLLLHSRSHELSLALVPKGILNRLVRLTPLHLLVVGFMATWWPVLGDGPLWSAVVAGAAACRRKFWWHALYLHNIVDADDQCLLPAWFLAVDFQLFIVALPLAIALARRTGRALAVLAALGAGAALLNTTLALRGEWASMLHLLTAENARSLFTGVPAFKYFYMAPWGSLPASLVGLFLAFLHFHLQERGFKIEEYKWLTGLVRWLSIPLIMGLFLTGLATQHWASASYRAVAVGLERPVVSGVCALYLFVMINGVPHWATSLLSWRGLRALGRLSLAALLLHWLLLVSLLAASHRTMYHSYLSILWEWAGAVVMTYAFAVPLTLMVEMPVLRSVSALT